MHIESDEEGFYLVIGDAPPILIADPERLYDSVKGQIGPWLREREHARLTREMQPLVDSAFASDESGPYDISSTKHPRYHSTHADLWDLRDGK